ncbi:MAG: Serine/threonine-protein kinase PknD [Planctomycetota bacterium]
MSPPALPDEDSEAVPLTTPPQDAENDSKLAARNSVIDAADIAANDAANDAACAGRAVADSGWFDRQCDRFEREFRAGGEPRIEDYLAECPAASRSELLRELLAVEWELRRRRGEAIKLDTYRARFPDDLAIVEESAAVTVPLTPAHRFAPGGIEVQGAEPDSAVTSARYDGLRLFRRGGLGALYRGRDEILQRDAVVKFMNEACASDPALVAQFLIEAEITGRLDHPGIVPVYGIGRDHRDRPFYVMRLIHGCELKAAIQEYHGSDFDTGAGDRDLSGGSSSGSRSGLPSGGERDRRRAPLRDRRRGRPLFHLLEHLVRACNTVAYAHHVGILHCDLKPANIMIGKYGETFVVDWGLAASFERTSTFWAPNEATMRPRSATNGGSDGRRGGTYGYVSPEQLSADAVVGPASDIYSLGATLYEILAGKPPFDGRDRGVREQIRLGRFPPPRAVQPDVCPRLEAICLKALHLDPTQRYPTAKSLAEDLENWMRDDEIVARPDRRLDRLARLGRRHRGATAALLVALLTAAASLAWIGRSREIAEHERALREQSERFRAVQEQAFANQRIGFTTALDTFEDLCRPMANGEMNNLGVFRPLVDKIRDFTGDYLDNFADAEAMRLPTARVYELRGAVSRVYSSDSKRAVEDFARAESLYQALPLDGPDRDEIEPRLARVRISQGRLFLQRREYAEAGHALEAAAEALERLGKRRPDDTAARRFLAEARHGLGELSLDRPSEGAARAQALLDAENQFTQSRTLREKLVEESAGDARRGYQRDLARSLGYLGDLHLAQGDVPRAASEYERSRTLRDELYRANPRDPEHRFQYARGLANFGELDRGYRGQVATVLGRLEEARVLQQELALDFDEVDNFWIDLGSTENLLAELYLFAALDESAKIDELRTRCRESAARAAEVHARLSRQGNLRGPRGLAQQAVTLAALDRDTDPAASRRQAADAIRWLDSVQPEPLLPSSDLVVLAMARSLLGQHESALRTLREAVARGENTAFRFERQALLSFQSLAADPVHGPPFRTLVEQVRASLRTAP